MSDDLIVAHKLQKRFGALPVIEDISIVLKEGDVCVLLGENGCGKTTLLRLLCGLELPTSGTIDRKTDGASMSYISQRCSLLPWRTALRNVALPLEFVGVEKEAIQANARHCLEVVGLEEYMHYLPHQLSGGMRQKVALARAIATKANIVFMDEPFNALDFYSREEAQKETLKLCHQFGIAIVLVTHDINEAVQMATRLFVLSPTPARIVQEFHIGKHLVEEEKQGYREHIFGALSRLKGM